jgi:hypothetical protein
MMLSALPPHEMTAVLDRGERVIWSGRPAQGLRLRGSDAYFIPFSLFWCGFICFWEWGVIHTNAPVFMSLWGIPFILMGIYLLIGRFFVDAMLRRSTLYAVTNDRILIISGLWSREIKSLKLKTLDEVAVSAGASGAGTISFGRSVMPYRTGALPGWPGSGRYLPPMFEMIPDVAAVATLIRNAQRALN